MQDDIEILGIAPVIYEFMGKKRKLRDMCLQEEVDFEALNVELNNLPSPQLKRTREVKDEKGKPTIEEIPYDEAMKAFKKEVTAYKKKAMALREQYLLTLFADGEITKDEARAVPGREWQALMKKLERQRYYDMGITDAEIDMIEKKRVKEALQKPEQSFPGTP